MKRALVLAGGGAKGSYQVGVWKALQELGWRPDIITGTSVGCLNGALFVLDKYEVARDMWLTIQNRDVMRLPGEAHPGPLAAFLQDVLRGGGLNVEPLEDIVYTLLDEAAMRRAPIRYGLVTVQQKPYKPLQLTLEEIPEGKLADYMLASAACFPAFRPRSIDGRSFIDGGYSDLMPAGLAHRMGAEEAICVNIDGMGLNRPAPEGLACRVIESHWELGNMLLFDPENAARNMELGYWDTLRSFGRVRGSAYAIRTGDGPWLETLLQERYLPLMARTVERTPSFALTEKAALALFERCTDPDLAIFEVAAEAAGVDPTRLYSGAEFCTAFIQAFGRERAERYAPLFAPEEEMDLIEAVQAIARPAEAVAAALFYALTGPAVRAAAPAEGADAPEPDSLPALPAD